MIPKLATSVGVATGNSVTATVYAMQSQAQEWQTSFDCQVVRDLLYMASCAVENGDGKTALAQTAEAFARIAHFHRY